MDAAKMKVHVISYASDFSLLMMEVLKFGFCRYFLLINVAAISYPRNLILNVKLVPTSEEYAIV